MLRQWSLAGDHGKIIATLPSRLSARILLRVGRGQSRGDETLCNGFALPYPDRERQLQQARPQLPARSCFSADARSRIRDRTRASAGWRTLVSCSGSCCAARGTRVVSLGLVGLPRGNLLWLGLRCSVTAPRQVLLSVSSAGSRDHKPDVLRVATLSVSMHLKV